MKRIRWLALCLGIIFTIPVLLAPGSLNSPSRTILIVLGILANSAALASFPALWHELQVVSTNGLLAVTTPVWLLTNFVLYLLRIQTPESEYLLAYQIVVSIIGLLSLAGVVRQPVRNSSELSGAARADWRDYLMLTKPIVVLLLLVTTLAAMVIAAGKMPPLPIFLWTALGGALSAGGASALNQYIDRERDGKMIRTQKRPLPGGRMNGAQAVGFGLLLCIAGFNILALRVNLLSAVMAFAGMVYYVLLYSIVLKPTTAQNIVIGGGAGAIPPLVGWAAATNSLSMPAFFLFALIFFWTPPHFWALALLKNRDYERAGVPMFPVVYGEQETRVHILLYAIQLVALTLLLPLAALGRGIYLVSAVALGLGFLMHAWRLWRHGTNKLAWNMYRYSSTYLALIFVALVVDTLVSL